ncbi:MAG: amidohydrolase [Dermatophilaceae bacterium]|nr:amidohydrolase family protein [Intrasporangiaceae bacterium]
MSPADRSTDSGSLLLRRARLVPVGAPAPDGEVDVLVRDGVVTEIGPGLNAPGVDSVDVEGRWLIPGLWDQHVHLGQWVLRTSRLDLGGVTDVASACAAVQERLAVTADAPVVAWGHRPATWAEQPSVAALDAVSDTVPIVLIAGDGHHGWLNTPGLALLGLSPRAGVVAEAEWFDTYPRVAEVGLGGDASPAAYRLTMEQLARLGVVGVVDLEFGAPIDAWGDRVAAGVDLLKVRTGAYPDFFDDYLTAGLRTGTPMPGCGPRQVFSVLKIISDGSLNTGTAWCCDPYPSGAGGDLGADRAGTNYGASNYSLDELNALVSRAVAAGIEVATHAIGDAAVAQALDVHARWSAPGSIEHAQLVRRADLPRMARLGLRASVQPAHLLDDRDPTEQNWPDRTERCFALRWMLDAGVTLALGSDAPVAPLDPWLAMAAAVHRSADDRDPWHGEQALTPAEALAASVDGQGTVHVGMPGDLVALDAVPILGNGPGKDVGTAEQARHLRGLSSALTVIDGRVAHTAL